MKKKLLLFTSICCFFLFFGITAHAEENLSATPDTWIKIFDEDLSLIKTVEGSYGTSESKPQVLTYEAELAAGTYYIKPSAGTNFNASYGNYILSWAPADTSNTCGNTNTSRNKKRTFLLTSVPFC